MFYDARLLSMMALPSLPTSYTTRKNIYEAAIVHRRTHENDFRQNWSNAADYFMREDLAAGQKNRWESNACFQSRYLLYYVLHVWLYDQAII